jgi:hypothetical protein
VTSSHSRTATKTDIAHTSSDVRQLEHGQPPGQDQVHGSAVQRAFMPVLRCRRIDVRLLKAFVEGVGRAQVDRVGAGQHATLYG